MKALDNIKFAYSKIWTASKKIFFVMFAESLITVFKTALDLFFVKDIINFIISDKFSFNFLFLFLFIYITISIIYIAIDSYIRKLLIFKFETIMVYKTKKELYEKIENIDLIEYNKPETYNKIDKAFKDSEIQYFKVFAYGFTFFTNILTLFFVFSLFNDAVLILATAMNVVNYISYYFISSKRKYKFDKSEEPYYRYGDYLDKVFFYEKYANELRQYSFIKNKLINKYQERTTYYTERCRKYLNIFMTSNLIVNSVSYIIFAAFSIYISAAVLNKEINTGEFVVALTVLSSMSNQIINLLKTIPDMHMSSLAIGDIREILEYKTSMSSKKEKEREPVEFKEILAKNISFSYDNNFSIDNVSFSIKKGQIIALVGLNGSGKTTLLDVIIRLLDTQKGFLYLNSRLYSDYCFEDLRSIFSIVFQDFRLYELSIAENILMREIESDEDENLVYESLKFVGLFDKIMALKDGIYTTVSGDLSTSELSGGECQKIAIARALANNKQILIFDEPTSAMDVFSEKEFFDSLSRLKTLQNKTIIYTTHRLEYTINADQIWFMSGGRLVESGTHSALMHLGKEYAELYNICLQRHDNGGVKIVEN